MATSKRAVGRMGLSGNLRVYASKSGSASSLKNAKSAKSSAAGKVVTTKRGSTRSA